MLLNRAVTNLLAWCGLLILPLHLVTAWLPADEFRDRVYYLILALWAASAVLSVRMASHLPPAGQRALMPASALLGFYALCWWAWSIGLPFITTSSWGVWVGLAGLTGYYLWQQPRSFWKRACWHIGIVVVFFSLCATLLYSRPALQLPSSWDALYTLPVLGSGLWFAGWILTRTTLYRKPVRISLSRTSAGHVFAFLILMALAFRSDTIADSTSIHHWRAFLESAESVRAGGWLLWDTPSQYGFLQTLLLALLPTNNSWQAFYLVNASLHLLVCYAVFALLFSRYHSPMGYLFSLSIALLCVPLLIPGAMSPIVYPSTGVMRFFWAYVMVGIVCILCNRMAQFRHARAPSHHEWLGHLCYTLGVLWSVESAAYVTVIWLPSLAWMSYSESRASESRATSQYRFAPWVIASVKRCLPPLGLCAAASLMIVAYYQFMIGHGPDFSLLFAYPVAYQSFMAVPITILAQIPCWLAFFVVWVLLLRHCTDESMRRPYLGLPMAPAYAMAATLWICGSYYIPFSENYHITGTLPLLVFMVALTLYLLPNLPLNEAVKYVLERLCCSFYLLLLLAGISHFDYGIWQRMLVRPPIHGNVVALLPPAPAELKDAIDRAQIPAGARVQIIYMNSPLEAYSLGIPDMRPWLLPNSLVGFQVPLSQDTYRVLAERRAMRIDSEDGWLVEAHSFPLESLPALNTAIRMHYNETASVAQGAWRIRHFQRHPSGEIISD